MGPAGGTLAVIGNLKQMSPRWLKGVSFTGYGASFAVGIGIPIPILNEEIACYAAATDNDLYAPVVDYSDAYPGRKPGNLGLVSYAELKSGKITVQGRDVPTAPMSSYPKAREIAGILKDSIINGSFLLTEPVQLLPSPSDGLSGNVLNG